MQDNFDKSLKKILQNHEVPYNPADWAAMEQQLNALEAAKTEQKNYQFAYWLAASVLLNIGLGTYLWWSNRSEQTAEPYATAASSSTNIATKPLHSFEYPAPLNEKVKHQPQTAIFGSIILNNSYTLPYGNASAAAHPSISPTHLARTTPTNTHQNLSYSSTQPYLHDNNSTFFPATPVKSHSTPAALWTSESFSLIERPPYRVALLPEYETKLNQSLVQAIADTIAYAQVVSLQPDSVIVAKPMPKSRFKLGKMTAHFGPEHNWTNDKARGNGYAAGLLAWLNLTPQLQVGTGISVARRSYTDNINPIVPQEMEVGKTTMTHFKMDGHSIEMPVLLAYRLNKNQEHPLQLKVGMVGGSQLQNRCSYGYAAVEDITTYRAVDNYGNVVMREQTREVRRQIHRQNNNYSAGKWYAATYIGLAKSWQVGDDFSCGIEPFMQVVLHQPTVLERIPNATGLRFHVGYHF